MIRAYYLYTGDDGNAHVTKGTVSEIGQTEVLSIHFKETQPHASFDWHNAPVTQYVITLAGILEFTTAGGEVFILEPGDVLVAMDTTGDGHRWRLLNNEPWKRAYVIFREGTAPNFIPDPA